MQLTTIQRVRARLGKSTDTDDALLGQIIDGVSAAAEAFMGRGAEYVSRTEYHNADWHQRRVALRHFGRVTVTTVHNDPERTYGASALVDATDYVVDQETGIITFDYELSPGAQAVKVVYLGGMGEDAERMVTSGFADVVDACTIQAAFMFQRRADSHLAGFNDPTAGFQLTPIDWLPWPREVLEGKRPRVAF